MEVAREIAEYKRANGLPVRDAAREEAVLSKVAVLAGPAHTPYLKSIYTALLAASRAYQENLLAHSSKNIVLIGMPGCGKTAIGQALCALTLRPLLDTDEEIAARIGKAPGDILLTEGEAAFRAAEKDVIAQAAARTGIIIATGGGSLLLDDNYHALAKNGWFVHIRRPLRLLATAMRPLSADLPALARARMPVYTAAADIAVDNFGTIEQAAQAVWQAYKAIEAPDD